MGGIAIGDRHKASRWLFSNVIISESGNIKGRIGVRVKYRGVLKFIRAEESSRVLSNR